MAKTRGESTPSPALEALPDLGARNPSTEALIAAKPDLLITDQIDKVAGNKGGPSVAEWKELGVATYVVGGGRATGLDEDSPGIGVLFADLDKLGAIFEVQAPARVLADQVRGRLDDVRRRTGEQAKPGVIEVSQVSGQLYVTSGACRTTCSNGRAAGTCSPNCRASSRRSVPNRSSPATRRRSPPTTSRRHPTGSVTRSPT
ncbi:hypothetical protein [Kibdelosporangium phytohabitans]|uniref:hypothetical protein n=1 Tax=Kibdelosporangium phytohabitans TaxID=860235 RepID=UPI0019F44920|nr:hypothetical protein [Kibdelosporangium phytohabitans]MBE1469141.1 ABC-type hemin transport system substrate-binding protein [Kibdelosporangium phytohabitans]